MHTKQTGYSSTENRKESLPRGKEDPSINVPYNSAPSSDMYPVHEGKKVPWPGAERGGFSKVPMAMAKVPLQSRRLFDSWRYSVPY